MMRDERRKEPLSLDATKITAIHLKNGAIGRFQDQPMDGIVTDRETIETRRAQFRP